MKVLGIETSTYSGSVAVIAGDTILGETLINIGPVHSEKLLPMIDWLLGEVGLRRDGIEGISVSIGPGSFTALRIGISTAKGLAFSLGIPVVGVSSLEILSRNLIYSDFTICTLVDARKYEVYLAFFKSSKKDIIRIQDDKLIAPHEVIKLIKEKTIFVGNGATAYRDLLRNSLGDLALFCPSDFNLPRASNCAFIGAPKFNENNAMDLYKFSPQYLRKADAEIYKER